MGRSSAAPLRRRWRRIGCRGWLGCRGQDVVAVAIGAFAGGVFVDDDLVAGGCDCRDVALGARNFGVAAG